MTGARPRARPLPGRAPLLAGVLVVVLIAVALTALLAPSNEAQPPFDPPAGLSAGVEIHAGQFAYREAESPHIARSGGSASATPRVLATYPARASKQIEIVKHDGVVDRLPARLPEYEAD